MMGGGCFVIDWVGANWSCVFLWCASRILQVVGKLTKCDGKCNEVMEGG